MATADRIRIRAWGGDADLSALVEVANAVARADGMPYAWDEPLVRDEIFGWHGMDLARDVLVAEWDGELVATGWVRESISEGAHRFDHGAFVLPDRRREGIGTALFTALIARASEMTAALPDDGLPCQLATFVHDGNEGGRRLAEADGYRPTRWYAQMARDLHEPLPAIVPVPGLELRPVRESEHRTIFTGLDEAFLDHFGHHAWTENDYRSLFHGPDVDTRLWRVAWDGAELAAASLNTIGSADNAMLGITQGWVEIIGVRRPWRGRGVARWLLAETLAEYARRGLDRTMLGVDLDNPTGALRLYESVGFRPILRSTLWTRELPRASGAGR